MCLVLQILNIIQSTRDENACSKKPTFYSRLMVAARDKINGVVRINYSLCAECSREEEEGVNRLDTEKRAKPLLTVEGKVRLPYTSIFLLSSSFVSPNNARVNQGFGPPSCTVIERAALKLQGVYVPVTF